MRSALVVLMGLPGSGKTTLARWLAANSDVNITSRDTIRAAMFQQCNYTLDEKRADYSSMKLAIAISLNMGRTVCTDGMTFANQEDRDDMVGLARDAKVPHVLFHCECPVPLAQARILADDVTVFPDRNAAAVLEVASRLFPLPEAAERLDMTLPTDVVGSQVLLHLAMLGRVQ